MQARQRTFMPLPDFNFRPGNPVALGRVVPIDRKTKLPLPERTFTDSVCITVPESRVSTQEIEHWEHNTDEIGGISGGVSADLSIFTGLGAGIKGNYGNQNGVKITSEHVKKLTFYPTPTELSTLIATSTVAGILDKTSNNIIWLVIGLMVAEGAEITEKTGRDRGGGAHLSADLTSTGAPINLGVNGERTNSQTGSTRFTVKGELLVGYQLMRIRRKLMGGTEVENEKRFALFHDEVPLEGALNKLDDYDFEIVAPMQDEAGDVV